ncbi:hypothetical protein P775_18570 [Puniceibacterium antarcticum]|uniref:DUF2934 domain-containing protein n=1 Tax=Puniceibacterium antarcticum TaxID=1206336 RepID=A0A2G8RAL5_9RHOB|nr:DUF2934 domain-containing protein [Puniceibacterium antarcticum]PIL18579.1 hypothetical protein P775_18570 [Puniceibacterium antarcticum]
MPQPDDSKIAEAAYLIWLDSGKPDGQDEAHWHRAKLALAAKANRKRAKKAANEPAPAKAKAAPKVKTASKTSAKPRAPRKAKAPE